MVIASEAKPFGLEPFDLSSSTGLKAEGLSTVDQNLPRRDIVWIFEFRSLLFV